MSWLYAIEDIAIHDCQPSLSLPKCTSSSSVLLADEIRRDFNSVTAVDSRTADVGLTLSPVLAFSPSVQYGAVSEFDLLLISSRAFISIVISHLVEKSHSKFDDASTKIIHNK